MNWFWRKCLLLYETRRQSNIKNSEIHCYSSSIKNQSKSNEYEYMNLIKSKDREIGETGGRKGNSGK